MNGQSQQLDASIRAWPLPVPTPPSTRPLSEKTSTTRLRNFHEFPKTIHADWLRKGEDRFLKVGTMTFGTQALQARCPLQATSSPRVHLPKRCGRVWQQPRAAHRAPQQFAPAFFHARRRHPRRKPATWYPGMAVFQNSPSSTSPMSSSTRAVSAIGHGDLVGHGQLQRRSTSQVAGLQPRRKLPETPQQQGPRGFLRPSRDATSLVPQLSRKEEIAQPVPVTPATDDSTRPGRAARGQTPEQTTRQWRN